MAAKRNHCVRYLRCSLQNNLQLIKNLNPSVGAHLQAQTPEKARPL